MIVGQPQPARYVSRRYRWPISQRQNPIDMLAVTRGFQHRVAAASAIRSAPQSAIAPRIFQLVAAVGNKAQLEAEFRAASPKLRVWYPNFPATPAPVSRS